MQAEKMKQFAAIKDVSELGAKLGAKVDTVVLTFTGFSRATIGREGELVGQLFTAKKGDLKGPLTGKFGAYYCYINDITEAPEKEDFSGEYMQQMQSFNQRVSGAMYKALEKTAKITDNRLMFY